MMQPMAAFEMLNPLGMPPGTIKAIFEVKRIEMNSSGL
jgi:hypothetical protein